VNWNDAREYAAWLSRKTGQRYRLPSEAEAEFIRRAGTAEAYPWGEDPREACRYANVGDRTTRELVPYFGDREIIDCEDGYAFTAPVGTRLPNAWGLYDTLGNVWEWTEDCYHENYESAPADGRPWTIGDCRRHMVRGGSWQSSSSQVRSASRIGEWRRTRCLYVGIRVARDLG